MWVSNCDRVPWLVRESHLLPAIFKVIADHQINILGGTMQNAVAILSNLIGLKDTDLQLFYQQGIIELVCGLFMEAVVLNEEKEQRCVVKSCSALLLSLLDIIHCLLNHLSSMVQLLLQSNNDEDTEEAEELLFLNRPLTDLNSLLIRMLPCSDADVSEEASQCVSLLAQLYGEPRTIASTTHRAQTAETAAKCPQTPDGCSRQRGLAYRKRSEPGARALKAGLW
ncbi:Serine/threonine-protein kinase ULK4 [Bagarius yarrelli]|uniref:Serine/threonine-protein kinase ULK4 n=1 Tax=Bagarius yarrelli TaxID=175774 RepID=A0A556TQ98_BAGYA|nr:Serine/threonine-protein kinase ULK4 [Bagarius yarrelli]